LWKGCDRVYDTGATCEPWKCTDALRCCCRDTLLKVKDAPRLLTRLQSTPSMPDLKDFSLLQDSLASMLLLR